jgi:hypothetical protein
MKALIPSISLLVAFQGILMSIVEYCNSRFTLGRIFAWSLPVGEHVKEYRLIPLDRPGTGGLGYNRLF